MQNGVKGEFVGAFFQFLASKSKEVALSENPYEVSAGNEDQLYESHPWTTAEDASQGKRLLNFLIDGVLVRILFVPTGFAFGIFYFAVFGGIVTKTDEFNLRVIGWVLGVSLIVAYYVVLEGLFMCTIGKLITGTRVVSADGKRATFGQIIGRSLARVIPFEPFSFLVGEITNGWHDTLSKTRVVDVRTKR